MTKGKGGYLVVEHCIILVGGLGTRLRSVLNDVPKPLAPINNKPFLLYLINNLNSQGVKNIILSCAYKSHFITQFLKEWNLEDVSMLIEDQPMGTGGALSNIIEKMGLKGNLLVLNGDTFFDIDMNDFVKQALQRDSDIHVASKLMKKNSRYGEFKSDPKNCNSVISGGIYFFNSNLLIKNSFSAPWSFEEKMIFNAEGKIIITQSISNDYFIDIGIPEDYERAQKEIPEIFKAKRL